MLAGGVSVRACDLCKSAESSVFAKKHGLVYLQCGQCGFVYCDVTDFDFEANNEITIDNLQEKHVKKLRSSSHQKEYSQRLGEFEQYRDTGNFMEIGCATGTGQARTLTERRGLLPCIAIRRNGPGQRLASPSFSSRHSNTSNRS